MSSEGEWGFDGLVVSDWIGTHSTAPSSNAGLDLEMPGPARHLGPKLAEAVRAGEVPESVLDDHVRRLLRLAERTGAFERQAPEAEGAIDCPEHRALARRRGRGDLLLKNDEVGGAPAFRSSRAAAPVALIGPNAVNVSTQGGGSARARPLSVRRRGCRSAWATRSSVPRAGLHQPQDHADARAGLLAGKLSVLGRPRLRGPPARVRDARRRASPGSAFAPEIDAHAFSVRVRGCSRRRVRGVPAPLVSAGNSRPSSRRRARSTTDRADPGEAFFGLGPPGARGSSSRRHTPRGRVAGLTGRCRGGLKVGCLRAAADLLERAPGAAACDAAIVVVGLNDEWKRGARPHHAALPGGRPSLSCGSAATRDRRERGRADRARLAPRAAAALW